MKTKSNARYVEFLPKYLQVSRKVSSGDWCFVLCTEQVHSYVGPIPANVPKEMLSQLRRKGYKPVFSSLPSTDFYGKGVQIHVFKRKVKRLVNPKAGVKNGKGYKVDSDQILRRGFIGQYDRFEIYKPGESLFRKRP